MEESAIHSARHIKRYVFIAAAIVYTLSVLILQLEGLPAEVHFAETLTGTYETLVGITLERECGALVVSVAATDKA